MKDIYFPVVVQAVAGVENEVYAYFSDGTIHLYDMTKLIQTGGVFECLKDKEFFVNRLTVMNDTIAWDLSGCYDPSNCIDIDPFEVYKSEKVEDPLEKIVQK